MYGPPARAAKKPELTAHLPFVISVGCFSSQKVPELKWLLALSHSVRVAITEKPNQLLGHRPLIPTRPLSSEENMAVRYTGYIDRHARLPKLGVGSVLQCRKMGSRERAGHAGKRIGLL